MAKVLKDHVGIFAFDPGGTTGVAWSMMKLRTTMAETLKAAEVFSQDITGEHDEQAVKLDEMFTATAMAWNVERMLPLDCIYVVSEGFTLRKIGSSAKVGLYPVWVAAMFQGMVYGRAVVEYQEPAQKKYATNDRLKRWGLWVPGQSDHQRDARRHIAIRLNRLL